MQFTTIDMVIVFIIAMLLNYLMFAAVYRRMLRATLAKVSAEVQEYTEHVRAHMQRYPGGPIKADDAEFAAIAQELFSDSNEITGPFVKLLDSYPQPTHDDTEVVRVNGHAITAGDLRRLAVFQANITMNMAVRAHRKIMFSVYEGQEAVHG